MPKIYVGTLNDYVDVSDVGRFELPTHDYNTTELKKISREINKALRELSVSEDILDQED